MRLITCSLWIVIGWTTTGLAQPPARPAVPKTVDAASLDKYVAEQFKSKDCVGLSVAVMRDGQVIFAKGYGTTALKNGSSVTTETPFAIGSITKQFACACILLLAEDGKLSIHDPVAKYYPNLTQAADITLYDLMSHVSGYPDYYPLDFLDRRMKQTIALDELIRQYAGGKLDFPPRSRWSYSNTGYIILGRVVEKVSGETFGKFLERRILKPIGMTNTHFEPAASMNGLAKGHTSYLLAPPESVITEADGWIHAAGGLYSSASDLTKWDLALVTGKVLKPESFRLMTTPRELSTGKVADYGCGLSTSRQGGDLVLAHNGAVSGFHAYNTVIPRTKSAVALLSNSEHADTAAIHRELVQLLQRDEAKRIESVPKIDGPPTKEAAQAMFRQLQAGTIDRNQLGEEYSLYLTEERVKAATPILRDLGEPTAVEVEGISERGGMEAARLRFVFKSGVVKVNMFRSTDGKIQQFLLTRG